MSTYNGDPYLTEQLASIFAQRNVTIDLLVRDDGSTDRTLSILEKYAHSTGRFQIMRCSNIGARNSFRELLTTAPDSEYYACADQDDVWFEDKISTGIDAIAHETLPALYMCNQRCIDAAGAHLGVRLPEEMIQPSYANTLFGNRYAGCTMVFNRQLLCLLQEVYEVGGEKFDIIYDALLLLIAQLVGVVVYDPEPHMSYRRHGGTYSDAQLYMEKNAMEKVKVASRKLAGYIRRSSNKGYLSYACAVMGECLAGKLTEQEADDLRYVASYRDSFRSWFSFLTNNKLRNYFPHPRYATYLKILTRTF